MLARHEPGAAAKRPLRRVLALIPIGALWGVQLAAAATLLPSDAPLRASAAPEIKREKKLGITTEKVDEQLAAQLDVDADAVLLVTDVDGHGPAGRAGLKRFDVITRVDGKQPVTRARLVEATQKHAAEGDSLDLRVTRKGKAMTISIPLGDGEQDEGEPDDVAVDLRGKPDGVHGRVQLKGKFDEDAFEKKMERLGEQLETKLGPALERLGPKLERSLKPRLEKLGADLERDLGPHLERLGRDVGKIVSRHLEDLGPELERTLRPHLESLQEDLKDLEPQLKSLGPILEKALAPLDDLGPELERSLKPELENLAPMIEQILQDVLPEVQRELRAQGVDSGEIEQTVRKALDEAKRSLKSIDSGDEDASQAKPKSKPKIKAKDRATRII